VNALQRTNKESSVKTQTVYFVAIVLSNGKQSHLCSGAFAADGKFPLTEHEAVARAKPAIVAELSQRLGGEWHTVNTQVRSAVVG
jgi:hypothetical protein